MDVENLDQVRIEYADSLCGVPDQFSRLWTPHRMTYIDGENKPKTSQSKDCPFCISPGKTDEDGLIVHRGEHAFVVMNLYPYSSGHMLVCPYRHVSWYWDLTEDETNEISLLTKQAMETAMQVMKPAGFNLGINQGDVAGAGIAAHLHQHVVPRWKGDANFMPIVAQTRAVPQLLSDGRAALANAWSKIIEAKPCSSEVNPDGENA